MKNFQKLFSLVLLSLFSLSTLNSTTFSQTNSLPTGLDKDSTFEEIVDWLNKNSFPKAIIGIESDGNYNYESNDIPNNATTYFEEAVFASGFKLDNSGTCKRLDLTNDNIRLLSFGTKYPDHSEGSLQDFRKVKNDQKFFSGELRIPLENLSYKGGKKTRKLKSKNKTLIWYSSYSYESDFAGFFKGIGLIFNKDKTIKMIKDQMENGMQVRIRESGINNNSESLYASRLYFRFEDKTASENFDSAFRQLIKICSNK